MPSSQPAVPHWLRARSRSVFEQRPPIRTERANVTAVERDLRNRRLHREVNERVVELIKQFALRGAIDSPMQVFCECGLERCLRPSR